MPNHTAGAATQLDAYRRLYCDAPHIRSTFALSSKDAFDYCAARRYFVLVLPYTPEKRLLVERTFSGSDISWSVLGGSLRPDVEEDFIEAASRLTKFNLTAADLADIEPIAFLTNTFNFAGMECSHEGVAFVARLRTAQVDRELLAAQRTRGHLVGLDTPSSNIALAHNATVFDLAKAYLVGRGEILVPFHDHEISENIQYRRRYQFHDLIVKPLLRRASRWGYEYTLDDLNATIERLIFERNPETLIDVACGENSLCQDLAAQGLLQLATGNDVSWSQIELMQQRSVLNASGRTALLFTNHDATATPFRDKLFSVAICKNVLHHMPSKDAVEKLISEAMRIADRAIIIEVMNPQFESRWGRIRHRYYLEFLRDAAVHFYSSDEFDEATRRSGRSQRFDMPTIRGVYQFAIFD